MVRANLPGADALVPNSVLRVMSDDQAALCHLNLQYLDWLALQLMPDTAETEWLDRHGYIWLVNADGSTGRHMAQLATGMVEVTGTVPWAVVPQGSWLGNENIGFETIEQIFVSATGLPTPVRVRALDPGVIGNVPRGSTLGFAAAPPGVNANVTVVSMDGGVDEENDDELRFRVLQRIRQPPQGGAWHDYINWALAVPGVTRVWVSPLEMGMGTVTVRVMMDRLRADQEGFPTQADLDAVTAYLDIKRPVAVKDFWVVSPIRQPVDIIVRNLQPDNPTVRAAIGRALSAMIMEKAAPGQTIYAAWKTHAIMNAAGVMSFDLGNCDKDDYMMSPGHLAVLGSIIYEQTVPPRPLVTRGPETYGESGGRSLVVQ
jgi:uncharacterized phage protein gp47/JayE